MFYINLFGIRAGCWWVRPQHCFFVVSFLAGTASVWAQQQLSFCAIADIPYDRPQEQVLREQLANQVPSSTCPFLIHLGDIRCNNGRNCEATEYTMVADILKLSPVPVFVLLGDNDWNDCGNPEEAYGYWQDTFLYFDRKHWPSSQNFNVTRQPGREYNFAIALEDSLILGLQIVGGDVPDDNERQVRLTEQYNWTRDTILNYIQDQNNKGRAAGRVVLAAHAEPDFRHSAFFDPLVDFIENTLQNNHPILLLVGDVHTWTYTPNFRGQSSFLKVILAGEGKEAPTIITINNNGEYQSPQDAFFFLRQESLLTLANCNAFVLRQFRRIGERLVSLFG